MQIPTLTSDPVRLKTCSKYGTESARKSMISSRIDPMIPLTTVFVRGFIELGKFRSISIANGANASAYFVMGVRTVAQRAIFVAAWWGGMLRVIWELTCGPKSFAPMNARDVYRVVTNEKLAIDTCKGTLNELIMKLVIRDGKSL